MTLTPAQAVAQIDAPRHGWDELSDHYREHCQQIAHAAIEAWKVNEANVSLAPPEYMPPSFHPERDGTLGEVAVGDRVMWNGAWREVLNFCARDAVGSVLVDCDAFTKIRGRTTTPVRIQKRATPAVPPREYRTGSGRVAYVTMRAGEVVAGMWVSWDGGPFREVSEATGSPGGIAHLISDGCVYPFGTNALVRVATNPADVIATQEQA